jgi:hypothetical protein
VTETNVTRDSLCFTLPIATNLIVGNFTNQITCLDILFIRENTFQASVRINELDFNGDDTLCITAPVFTNLVSVGFTNETICYSIQVNCSGITNSANFVGTVLPGKRLLLAANTSLGKVLFRGVPATVLPDISGAWSGIKRAHGVSSLEFFQLLEPDSLNGVYLVDGMGADYSYHGAAIVSSQKKIAFAAGIAGGLNDMDVRATLGSFNFKNLTANTAGVEGGFNSDATTNRISFQVRKRASVP